MQKHKILGLILLSALVLRLPLLNGSFWLDEAAQALESTRPLSQQLNIGEDYQPPLFHVVVHFFSLISTEEWWMRSPSLLAGIGTIAILYLVLEEKFGRRTAILGSILLAVSPFHIFYSQELRPYSLATLWAALSWFVLLSDRFKSKRWVWYVSVSALGMYTMYLYPFILLSQLIFVLMERRLDLKSIVYSQFAVALFFLPWLPSFLNQLHIGTALTSQLPGWSQAVATPQVKAIPLTLGKFLVGQIRFSGNSIIMVLTGALLLSIALQILSRTKEKKVRFLLYWLIIPIFTSWLVSFFVPIIQPKRLLICLPALMGLIAIESGRFWRGVVAAVFILETLSLVVYFQSPLLQRENWKGAVQRIEASAPVGSTALFAFPTRLAPWEWYNSGKVRYIATSSIIVRNPADVSSVRSQLASVTTVYLFDYLRDLTDPNHQLEKELMSQGFVQTEIMDGFGIGFVRVFAMPQRLNPIQ